MKNPRLIIALVVSAVLGVLLFAEYQATSELKKQIALFRSNTQAHIDETDRLNAEIKDLKRQLADKKDVISQLESRNKEIASAGGGDAAPGEKKAGEEKKDKGGLGGFGKMMEKMFTDPEMKKVMKSQQTMAIQMMYKDLAKELGLESEQAKLVMDLLADRQMAMTGKGMKMLSGDKADGQAAEDAGKEIADSQADYDKQLEGILGKDGMAKLSEYERTAGDRMQISQYKNAFSASGVPLDDAQSQSLLSIMKEERMKQPASPLEPGSKDVGAAVKAMQSDEAIEAAMASQDALNQRVLDRSRTVLSADQMSQFETIQKQQTDMQKMGIKMGREFLKGK